MRVLVGFDGLTTNGVGLTTDGGCLVPTALPLDGAQDDPSTSPGRADWVFRVAGGWLTVGWVWGGGWKGGLGIDLWQGF